MGSIAVLVKDGRAAADWYRERLSFEASIQGHWVTVKLKGSTVELHLCEKCVEWGDDRPGGQTGIALHCDDLEVTYRELRAKA